MKKKRSAAMFKNKATPTGEHDEVLCQHCDEPLVFGMKDNYHEFSIGLTTILECLAIAEHKGYVPPFPAEWWIQASRRYAFLPGLRNRLLQEE